MTRAPGRDQRAMQRLGAIVDQLSARRTWSARRRLRAPKDRQPQGPSRGCSPTRTRCRARPAATRATRSASEMHFRLGDDASARSRRDARSSASGPATRAPLEARARARRYGDAVERRAFAGDREVKPLFHRREDRRQRPGGRPPPARPRSPSRCGRRHRRACRRSDRRSTAADRMSRARSSSLSSESQPQSGASRVRRSRRKWSTAMSASVTGEPPVLVQFLSCASGTCCAASAPASRTAASSSSLSGARAIGSGARNGQALPSARSARWCRSGIRDRSRASSEAKMSLRCPGDRDLAHRIGEFAVLDPQARRAAAVVAGDEVGAHADQVGDVEAVRDVGDQLLRALRARLRDAGWSATGRATTKRRATRGRSSQATVRARSPSRGTRT